MLRYLQGANCEDFNCLHEKTLYVKAMVTFALVILKLIFSIQGFYFLNSSNLKSLYDVWCSVQAKNIKSVP